MFNQASHTFSKPMFRSGSEYSFSFNGQERDDEIAGVGNIMTAEFWEYDTRLGRRWNLDPLAQKYPSYSAYTSVINNPILLIDRDGRKVYIYGDDAKVALAALQKTTSLKLSLDPITHQVTATGLAKSQMDEALERAIRDEQIEVNLITTNKGEFVSKDGSAQPILIGGYDGSTLEDRELADTKPLIPNGPIMNHDPSSYEQEEYLVDKVQVVKTTQYINMRQSEAVEKAGLSTQGSDVAHEILESYFGGQNDPGGTYNKPKWEQAHQKAMAVDPYIKCLKMVLSRSSNEPIGLSDESGSNRVILR